MNTLTQFLSGKRTYLVASIAIAYLLYCQQTKQTPDETILGIFGALGLAALRAGIPATGSVTKPESNGAGYPFPPQTPRADTNGITRTFPCILACLMVFGLTGCTSPGTLTEAKVAIVDGKKSIKLGSHKDTIIEEFERSPDGTIRIKGYKSVANEGAIQAGIAQGKILENAIQQNVQMLQLFGGLAAQYFSAGAVRPPAANPVPATLVLTPNAAPAASTNAPAK